MKSIKTYRAVDSKRNSVKFDQTIWLAGLTLLVFGYILFHFLYPMFHKGLLF